MKRNFLTIKAVVFDFIHRTRGRVEYAALEKQVLRHFPKSAFKKTHWAWYKYQCTKGRFAGEFTALERKNLSASTRVNSPAKTQKGRKPQAAKRPRVRAMHISTAMFSAIQRVRRAALSYEKATGGNRKMGITAEVGEVLACQQLGLRLTVDPRSKGFDALDRRGRRVQIKTRRSESSGLPSDAGRVGTFSEHPYDYALLVILDRRYELAQIWRVAYEKIEPLIRKHKRRNPNLSSFKKAAKCVWERAD